MEEIINDPKWERLEYVTIESEYDIVKARQLVRFHSKKLGFGIVEQTRLTTASSELFRNMYHYANGGEVIIDKGEYEARNAIIITCIDRGEGIDNLELAMSDGYTSGLGMGYGLPGAKRLVDNFDIYTEKNKGTTVRLMKWI